MYLTYVMDSMVKKFHISDAKISEDTIEEVMLNRHFTCVIIMTTKKHKEFYRRSL